MDSMEPTPRVAIIGAGMSGLCMAAKLKAAGIETFTIYEQADALGGTWRANTYPGLTCDVPSRFYQFRFAPNPGWTHWFSTGPEIARYFDDVADRLRIGDHVELASEVTSARFEDPVWRVALADGRELTVDFVISACGVLRVPRYPSIPGLESFAGAAFHSARWDHDVRLPGRRVGLIGTGSTGAQIVGALGGVAGELTLFQRTAQWMLPMVNPRYSRLTRALHRRFPRLDRLAYDRWRRAFEFAAQGLTEAGWRRSSVQALCRRHLQSVKDPELRRALTPDYEPMCKRLVVSSRFYPAIQRDDVTLVTERIDHIEPAGIVTADGTVHELDVLVLATGFDAHAYVQPIELTGRDGVTLDGAWEGGPRAYMTVALPAFPNFFMLMGPHSPVGNYSLTEIADTQAEYITEWIGRWQAGRYATAAPTQAATDRFNAALRTALPGTVWATGCNSWYLDQDGLPELWAWAPHTHREMLATPRLDDYQITTSAPEPTPA
ncbi:MAG TPA: NAD(P)/FAD-dependent oxidoreductase [Solirubrobacteraceae bacterium]|jgi:cation diffusion facilitator CzcD-associated flavoprotein CzcO|nr:NAD(P)/FAD-dependent oxidoreductase [Solirubrobacteraceae bacterium]